MDSALSGLPAIRLNIPPIADPNHGRSQGQSHPQSQSQSQSQSQAARQTRIVPGVDTQEVRAQFAQMLLTPTTATATATTTTTATTTESTAGTAASGSERALVVRAVAEGRSHEGIAQALVAQETAERVGTLRDESGATLLMLAARNGSTGLTSLLLSRGADACARDETQRTAFHEAAGAGHTAVLELLLPRAPQPVWDAPDADGDTPLVDAIIAEAWDTAALLLRHGARLSLDHDAAATSATSATSVAAASASSSGAQRRTEPWDVLSPEWKARIHAEFSHIRSDLPPLPQPEALPTLHLPAAATLPLPLQDPTATSSSTGATLRVQLRVVSNTTTTTTTATATSSNNLRIVSTNHDVTPPFTVECIHHGALPQTPHTPLVVVGTLLDSTLHALSDNDRDNDRDSNSQPYVLGHVERVGTDDRAVFQHIRFTPRADSAGHIHHLQFFCYEHYGTPDQRLVGFSQRVPLVIVHTLDTIRRGHVEPAVAQLLMAKDLPNLPWQHKFPWKTLAAPLPAHFAQRAGAARTLIHHDIQYLRSRVAHLIDSDGRLTLLAFQEHCLSWLQGAAETLQHDPVIRGMWDNGLIHGFITRMQAEDLLRRVERHTMCIRFSDSDNGVLTVGYVPDRPAPGSSATAVAWAKISPESLRVERLVDILIKSRIPRIVDAQGQILQTAHVLAQAEAAPYASVLD